MTHSSTNQWLSQHGLLLCAFRWLDLPSAVSEPTYKALPDDRARNINENTILVLLANAGPTFWRTLQQSPVKNQLDPVDEFSTSLAQSFQDTFLGDSGYTQLYPTPVNQSHIPLMRLGSLAGWNVASPLGLGLHPKFGPWSAYRAAWLTESTQLPSAFLIPLEKFKHTVSQKVQHISELCIGCAAPCATACPAKAVKLGKAFNTDACYQHSRPTDSDCHTHCAARRACPIGQDYEYDNDQLAHHMGMRWRNA